MKSTYIALTIIVLLVLGYVFLVKNQAEAPVMNAENALVTDAVREFTVVGKNFAFTPSLITVKKGDKVKVTFKNENGYHDFVIDEFGAATKQTQAPTTEVIEFTANKTGTFEYYCSVGSHRAMGMKGTLKVE